MQDAHGRTIDYLRVSVTDRCNLRCGYCLPPDKVHWLPPEAILSFEEIEAVVRAGVALGIRRVRLTGGEPLVRRQIARLVAMLASIDGLDDLSLTTNGQLLAGLAQPLAAAGLRRVNVSVDTLDPARYAEITQGGELARVLEGLAAAKAAGLRPIKLNCVVGDAPDGPHAEREEYGGSTALNRASGAGHPLRGSQPPESSHDAEALAEFARREGFELRLIPRMHLSAGHFGIVTGGSGGDCPKCNRLRLTCDGLVRPCLFSNLAFSVRELGPTEALRRAVAIKPPSGSSCTDREFHAIGG